MAARNLPIVNRFQGLMANIERLRVAGTVVLRHPRASLGACVRSLENLSAKTAHAEFQKQQRKRNSNNPDIVFIWVPKTAGTSLWSILAAAGGQKLNRKGEIEGFFLHRGVVTFGHASLPALINKDLVRTDFLEKAWKFGVVRNPFDRAVSLFEYLKKGRLLPEALSFSLFCQLAEKRQYESVGAYNHRGLSQLNPQCRWLIDNGTLLADDVFKLEDLEPLLVRLQEQYGLEVGKALPRLNSTARRPLKDYYGDIEIAAILSAYNEDFEAFGYSRDPWW